MVAPDGGGGKALCKRLGPHRLQGEEAGEVGIGLQGSANGTPVVESLLCTVDKVERFLTREPVCKVVVGFVTGLLEIAKCRSNPAERWLKGLRMIAAEKFLGHAAGGKLPGGPFHCAMVESAGQATAERFARGPGEHESGAFVYEQVKKGVIGGRHGTAQTGLGGTSRLLASQMYRLTEKIVMQAQNACSISEAARKRT